MRIHHLNCISACPVGGWLMDGASRVALRARLTCHCLLLECDRELVLVDTGYGLRDVAAPFKRLSRLFLTLLMPDLREEMTAFRQIQRLGFDPRDVRHIVLTHLDFDHAGGLDDFPGARVHLLASEEQHASMQRTLLDRMRYRPAQWSTRSQWVTYPHARGDAWFGFDCVRELEGLRADVGLVPLLGHTHGHAGVLLRRAEDWLLFAGDAYFFHGEMDVERPQCTPGLRAYQTLMEKDRTLRLANQARLRALKQAHAEEVRIVCSHDVREFEALAGRSHDEPVGPSFERLGAHASPREPAPA